MPPARQPIGRRPTRQAGKASSSRAPSTARRSRRSSRRNNSPPRRGAGMARLSRWYGRLLDLLVIAASILLLVMTVMIGADVVSRNLGGGIAASNELSEDLLYL